METETNQDGGNQQIDSKTVKTPELINSSLK